ncbi:hypothetical protein A3J98_01560 [candidate division WS6 bacterium RIFOXYC1_FULL_33_10]|uniref:Uncharacterized protein n=1 Tax=candidate division WS6 bacterium RIFOXYC1_FULL_33_10 TaxID=1802606 RepID=A0A1F4URF9_9BACT|nr:MAG: hypothetical protein A3J98_01560 [candidate division WS6 bacterium RIFOXYC1_FULL_33_10]
MDKSKISKFRPILPARYNTAAYMDWMKYFSKIGTDYPVSYFERLDLPMRNFVMYASLESKYDKKIPLVVMSPEVTPNLSMNFNPKWFKEYFETFRQIEVAGVIVTDRSEEGKELNSGIKKVLEEEKNRDWMVESIENLEQIEGVCERYIEKIEYINPISIEYREKK